ncbi:MAG: DNA sulfur modification protein DndD [Lachnospiraceae bacterium]|nr:DNA sulfur modification protein DndD [Lachnospiraceae bacterium]
MIIKRLVLHNFGVYAGTNEFEFHGEKPIVLVGGLNGRGKTTFLEAVLLALYGKNSFAYSESDFKAYGSYLRSYVNEADGTKEAYVQLDFIMNDNGIEEYSIKRLWNSKGRSTSETIAVKKDGKENEFLTDNWAMFMEYVLPSGLSNFFFFDGEKIADLAVEKTSKQMKESIKALLGITVLDHLENDLNRIVSRTKKNKVDDAETEEIEKLRVKKDKAIVELENIDEEIKKTEKQLHDVQRKLDKIHEEYVAKGGDIVIQRQELMEKRSITKARFASCGDELLSAAASELPLVLVRELLTNIREKAEIEHEQKILSSAIEKMYTTLEKYKLSTSSDGSDVTQFIEFFKKQSQKKNAIETFELSDTALLQVQILLDQKLTDRKCDTYYSIQRRDELKAEVDQLESYLSVDIDEKAINRLFKKLKQMEEEQAVYEAKLDHLQEKRKTLNGNSVSATAEFNKRVEAYLKKVELNDDSERIIKYANVANAIIEKYRIELQKNKVNEVAETMTNCYKLLANKKTLIDRIEMNPESLDLIYLNKIGEETSKTSLSAGEKQLMVIALLWALAICSKKRLPVIIDTPLSRLDSIHRQALIKTYFPQVSDQTIILSTDSEIDKKCYDMMAENIDDEFTLVYDDVSKSTSIKKGYFV